MLLVDMLVKFRMVQQPMHIVHRELIAQNHEKPVQDRLAHAWWWQTRRTSSICGMDQEQRNIDEQLIAEDHTCYSHVLIHRDCSFWLDFVGLHYSSQRRHVEEKVDE